jgi:trigger factor
MQISVTADGLERRMEVAVPADEVQRQVDERLQRLSRTARLKGFRPGRAPFSVVRQQFGEQVHAEVVGELMRSSFADAVSKEHLTPATGPRIEPIAFAPGTDLKYAAVFEVMPEVKLEPFDAIAIERPVASVEEQDIDAMIESMRRQRPSFAEVARAARDTDRVTVDYDGRIEDRALEGGEGRDASFVIGASRVLPELERAIVGAAAGETRTAEVVYPESHPNKALAGRKATFTIHVKKVEEQSLPAVDEAFCRAFGVDSGELAALRAEVRKSLERELAERVKSRLRSQVLDALYRDHPLELPRGRVSEAVEQLQIELAQRVGVRDVSQLPPRETFEEPARRRVALGALIGEIVRAEGLEVDRERLEARLTALTATYPNPAEARRAYHQSPEAMRELESAALEDQAIDAVLARARVTERPMSFKELTGFQPAETHPSETHNE